jgi:zinc D-Ala-D-Ala dipeptidase
MARFLARTILLLLCLFLVGLIAYGVGRFVRMRQQRGTRTPPRAAAPAQRAAVLPVATATESPAPAAPAAPSQPAVPVQQPPAQGPELVNVATVVPDAGIDLRYATSDNLTGHPLYTVAVAYLRPATAKKLAAVVADLKTQGYGLKVWDAYRPLAAQKALYKASPVKGLVADPKKGSMHNRGAAVDVTLTSLPGGENAEMPSGFDDITQKARVAYAGASDTAKKNRTVLIATMTRHGFRSISNEWWHFDDRSERNAPLLDIPLDKVVVP